MRYIGEGFYYRVYECNSETVLKKLLPVVSSFKKIYNFVRERENKSRADALLVAYKAIKRERKELKTMKARIETMPGKLFANPKFVGKGLDYTQDKVSIIGDILENSENAEAVIDKYMEFQKKLWSYNIHDTTYKLQPNYGIDRNGDIVCVDFGEFVFTKEQALKSIKNKKWLSRGSYKKWKDGEIKKYYTDRMAETMTEEMLEKFWDNRWQILRD